MNTYPNGQLSHLKEFFRGVQGAVAQFGWPERQQHGARGRAEYTGTHSRRHGPAVCQSHCRAGDQTQGPQAGCTRAGDRGGASIATVPKLLAFSGPSLLSVSPEGRVQDLAKTLGPRGGSPKFSEITTGGGRGSEDGSITGGSGV